MTFSVGLAPQPASPVPVLNSPSAPALPPVDAVTSYPVDVPLAPVATAPAASVGLDVWQPSRGSPDVNPVDVPDAVPLFQFAAIGNLFTCLLHPLQTGQAIGRWFGKMREFDRLGKIQTTEASQAIANLRDSASAIAATGLDKVFPWLARPVEKRASRALAEFRPDLEEWVANRAGGPVMLTWASRGPVMAALRELDDMALVLRQTPEPVLQRALSGVRALDIRDRSGIGPWSTQVSRQGAMLVIERPREWLGDSPVPDALRQYLARAGTVAVAI